MNRWNLLFVSACLITAGIFAQEQPIKSKAFWGIKGGVCFANQKLTYDTRLIHFNYQTYPYSKYRIGFDAVIYLEIPIHWKQLAVMAEIHYIQKGMKDEMPFQLETGAKGISCDIYKAEYLSVPLLCKWRIPMKRITPYIMLGPRMDFFLSSQAYMKTKPPIDAPVYAHHMFFYEGVKFQKIDLGVTVGLGVEVSLKRDFSVLLEFRYDHSYSNSANNEAISGPGSFIVTPTIRNRSFQFLAGIRLPMKGIGVKVNAEKDRESF